MASGKVMAGAGLAMVFACLAAPGSTPARSAVGLAVTHDVGYGNEVFVAGAHPDLSCGGILSNGIKLTWTSGNIWTGNVAVEAGAQVGLGFYSHSGTRTGYFGGGSVLLGAVQTAQVAAAAGPPYTGKVVRYSTGWSAATLVCRDTTRSGFWTNLAMHWQSLGRTAGENIFEVDSVAAAGHELEFVFTDGAGHWDNAPAPPQNTAQGAAPAIPAPYQALAAPFNYRCSLDVFWVQDGQVFNDAPPATVSPPSVTNRFVNSTVSGIPGRLIRIYLPRGYTQNTTKRYPVLYFHDGQNVFFPGGTFGTWDADRIATYETQMGRMREAIIVAVDNGNDYGSDRMKEYLPPTDSLAAGTGVADTYAQFLRDNVLPTLDYNYRTLNPPGQAGNPGENLTAGSSLGGLVCAYLAMTQTNVYRKVGIFSPAFWAAPNFRSSVLIPMPRLPLRLYLDIGSAESSASESDPDVYWNDAAGVYNTWLAVGYVVNRDLLFNPAYNAIHNEDAWSRRLPVFYRFMLDPWDEANRLAALKYPPRLSLQSVDRAAHTARLQYLAPRGIAYTPCRSSDLHAWTNLADVATASALWEARTVDLDTPSPASGVFWKLIY